MKPRHLLAALCTAAACGSDPDRPSVVVNARDCDTLPECAIASSACQRGVLEITACVRGDDTPALPPIRTLTRQQLRAELSAQLAASATDMPDEAAQLSTASIEKALEALKLVAAQSSLTEAALDEQVSSIAAFYREQQQDITVISDATMDRGAAMNALAHEFTHYLQDEAGQLAVARKDNVSIDESLARRALAEGEAEVTSYRSSAQMLGYPPRNVRWNELFTRIESSIAAGTNASDSPLITALNQLPYAISPRAIEQAWEAGERFAVDALFDAPPLTQLDWLSGNPGSGRSIAERLDCQPPLPPDGFELVGTDSLGVAGLYAMLGTQGVASLETAKVWRKDVLAVYRATDGDPSDPTVLAVWRVRFSDDTAAMRFAGSLAPLGLSLKRFGRELAISVSAAPDVAPMDAQALASCPSEAQLKAASPQSSAMHASIRLLPRAAAHRLEP